MPEREYFSFRYAVPGFTFLLLVVVINHVPLLKIFSDSDFGTFLGFLSLGAGSAIGFLVSQFWHLHFAGGRRIFGIPGFKEFKRFLVKELKKYNLKRKKEDELPLEAILDFIRHKKKEDATSRLSQRRWDMYHVLSSTFYSLIAGSFVGIGLRVYYEWFLFKPHFEIPLETYKEIPLSQNAEAVALSVILICVGTLLVVFWVGVRRLMVNYYPLLEAFVRCELEDCGEKLATAFPDYFASVAPANPKDG